MTHTICINFDVLPQKMGPIWMTQPLCSFLQNSYPQIAVVQLQALGIYRPILRE